MGQQQIMILILVTVLVGIATVLAVNTMQDSYENANRDAVQQDMLIIANEAQAHYFKAEMMGGGGRSFTNFTLDNTITSHSTENGTYSLTVADQTLTIEGEGTYEGVYVRAEVTVLSDSRINIDWSYEES